jgi:hypothetical protein
MTRLYAVALAFSAMMVWTGGCQEEQQVSSDVNLHRLIAAENRELKEKLVAEEKKRDDEIKKLVIQHQAEMKKRDEDMNRLKEQLAQCEQAKQNSLKAQQEEQKRLDSLMSALRDWNTNLTTEVRRLKAELAKRN